MNEVMLPQNPSSTPVAVLLPDGFRLLLPAGTETVTPEILPASIAAALAHEPWQLPASRGVTLPPIPSYPLQASELTLKAAEVGGKARHLVELPPPLANLLALDQALAAGHERDLLSFVRSYTAQVSEELARDLKTLFRSGKFGSVKLHLDTDPRVEPGEWGLASTELSQLLVTGLLRPAGDGWELRCPAWVERHPVTGPLAISPVVRFVELSDRVAGHLYGSFTVVKHHLNGDVDGDEASIILDPSRRASVPVRIPGALPALTLQGDPGDLLERLSQWTASSPEADAGKVVGMMVRTELTGLLTYAWKQAVHLYALAQVKGLEGVERRTAFREAYQRGFLPFTPVSEGVFDGWKAKPVGEETKEQAQNRALAALCRVADALEDWVGGQVDPAELQAALAPYQEPETGAILAAVLAAAPQLQRLKHTPAGRLLTAGSKKLPVIASALQEVVRWAPEQTLSWLLDDLHGVKAASLPHREERERRPQALPTFQPDPEARGVTGVLALHYRAKSGALLPVFADIRTYTERGKDQEPRQILRADLAPWWLWDEGKGLPETPPFTWRVNLELPLTQELGYYGHFRVRWANCKQEWVFRPRLEVQPDGRIGDGRYRHFLAEAVQAAVQELAVNRFRNSGRAQKKVQKDLCQALRVAVDGLAVVESPGDADVYSGEFEVRYPEGLRVSDKLRLAQVALTKLARCGSDVLTTSKSAPGTLISVSERYGVPDWAAAVFPLDHYCQPSPKRRSENRGLREALLLHRATPRGKLLTFQGLPIPAWLDGRVVLCRVAFADLPGINVYVDEHGKLDHFDTLTATHHGIQATAIAETVEWLLEEGTLLEVQARYRSQGVPDTAMHVERVVQHIAEGVATVRWKLRVVYPEGLLDVGKKKSDPPIKGVPAVLPPHVELHAGAPIDFVVSLQTLKDKEGLNALLLALLYEAGVEDLDPHAELGDLLARIEPRTQPVTVTDEHGTRVLGNAWVGWLPFYVAPETSRRTAKWRKGSVEYHSQVMAGLSPERAPGWKQQAQRFDERAQALRELLAIQDQLNPRKG